MQKQNKTPISIIIPVYNEVKILGSCLDSLSKQTVTGEVIVVDDGSTDGSVKYATYKQSHLGPGAARNLGARNAKGEILVFVDADMEFAPDFIAELTAPIRAGKAIGTFSKSEYLLNAKNPLARCWNLNLGRNALRMVPADYPDESPVFRAIKKNSFLKVGGFDSTAGYTDDWSLSRKLGQKAIAVPKAIFYHRNPETFSEIWSQARWYGKNEFLTGNLVRKIYNLVRYNPALAVIKGIFGAIHLKELNYFTIKVVYDTAVFTSVILSFFGEQKYK